MDSLISFLQSFFTAVGCPHQATSGDVWGILAILFFIIVSLYMFLSRPQATEVPAESRPVVSAAPSEKVEEEVRPKVESVVTPKMSWAERLSKGLSKTREDIFGKIFSLIRGNKIDNEVLESIEEILYGADLGPSVVAEIIETLSSEADKAEDLSEASIKGIVSNILRSKIENYQGQVPNYLFDFNKESHESPRVIMIVGVNGAGKTTTIGKVATRLVRQGANVVVGACDTFRAAAVDQLQVWCERAGATMVRAKEGADPSGVAYEALQRAINEKADYCIIDTAGRLHTKANLMEEIKKSKNVLSKLDTTAPHQTILVLDAITGQNAMRQAEEFHKTLNLDGLIFTKCDGSSKAGAAIGIVDKLKLPISYIGVGEGVDDLDRFDLTEYLKNII